jgi:hypothetical protein
MNLRAFTPQGLFEELKSGTAVLPMSASSFTVDVEDLEFTFIFVQRDGEQTVEEVSKTSKSISLHVVNFTNPMGTSWESDIGIVNGRTLVVCLYASSLGQVPTETRHVTYSFYLRGA